MHPFTTEYTAQALANATGCDVRKISDWATRGLIVGHEGGGVQGRNRRFSWFNVMEVAIASELMGIGNSSVTGAFTTATHFAHMGEGQAGWVGDPPPKNAPRLPGLPWHHNRGYTFMFVWNGGNDIRLTDRNGTVELNMVIPQHQQTSGFLVVNVLEVFERVCGRIGLDYREVLDQEYPSEAD